MVGIQWLKLVLLVTILHTVTGQLRLHSTCVCPGNNLVYECTVNSTALFTVWSGSAFNCSGSGDQITLRRTDRVYHYCNDTRTQIAGKSVLSDDQDVTSNFTTQLNVMVTTGLNGSSVECREDLPDSVNRLVGEQDIILTPVTDPFLPPTNVTLTTFNHKELNFSWKRNSIDLNCSSIFYKIHQTGCGNCSQRVGELTHAKCSLPNLTSTPQPCTLAVQSIICDHIEGTLSDPVHVSLKAPSVPLVEVIPRYSQRSKQLTKLIVKFRHERDEYNISSGMLDCTSHYDVMYTMSANGVSCGNENILAGSCENDTCTSSQSFNLSGSRCLSGNDIIVSVSATNGLAIAVTNHTADGINQFVSVVLNSVDVICSFLEQQTNASADLSCSITYGQCRGQNNITEYGTRTDSLSTTVKIRLSNSEQELCYVIDASNGTYAVQIEGMFAGTRSQAYIAGIVIAALLCSLFVAVVTSISLVYCTKDRFVFSIDNEPGALVSALKVFKKHELNITKIKMRPSNNCRDERIIYIVCKKNTVARNDILTELIGLNAVNNVYYRCHICGAPCPWHGICDSDDILYISFKVDKDKAGSMFEALQCFEELKINIVDLKTRTFGSKDRDKITIHVKCKTSEDERQQLKRKFESVEAEVISEFTSKGADELGLTCLPGW